jgi:uncharacterized membrane protein
LTKYCPKCGEPNPDDALYCIKCGAPFPQAAGAQQPQAQAQTQRIFLFLTYVLTLITGFIFYLIAKDDKELRKHSLQAILLGVIQIIVAVVFAFIPFIGFLGGIINFLIWVYGLYVGYEAYSGREVRIPVISDFADTHV